MYVILRNRDKQGLISFYKGAICVITGKPWYVTSKQGPDLWSTIENAEIQIMELEKFYSGDYEVMDLGEYLHMIKQKDEYSGKIASPDWYNEISARAT